MIMNMSSGIKNLFTCQVMFMGVALALKAQDNRPNILIIMVDDMGYSDPGCFGGEIETPNIDRLSEDGVRLTQFYNCARSCPTRASLLTGLYAQQAGLTNNGNSLTQNCVTLAEVLKEAGYQTGMAGKWHLSETRPRENKNEQLEWLAHRKDFGPFAPLATYPCNRGFDEHWGVIWGVVDYYDPFSLVHNEEPIKEVPQDFYMTDFITDHAVQMIDRFTANKKPFFLYVAHDAPHWPLMAPEKDIAKYRGKYDGGWDSLRVTRYKRMIELGLVDPVTEPCARNESGEKWADCERKEWESRHMEVHAAMVDHVDQGIGKIVAELKKTGAYNNTIVFFLSDNGASPERGFPPGFDRAGTTRDGREIVYNDYYAPGPETTWGYLGKAWAGALNTPYRFWKAESYHGGNATPFIMEWPEGLKVKRGSINRSMVGHVIDIMPTCLHLARASYPEQYRGHRIEPYEGISLAPFIAGEDFKGNDTLYWEHSGGRAIRAGDWKLSALRNRQWELFNLKDDLTETMDLSCSYPEKVQEMNALWRTWAERVGLDIKSFK